MNYDLMLIKLWKQRNLSLVFNSVNVFIVSWIFAFRWKIIIKLFIILLIKQLSLKYFKIILPLIAFEFLSKNIRYCYFYADF